MSFVKRRIDVTFSLDGETFSGTDANTVTVTGLRVSATIVKTGGNAMGESQFRIFGLSPTLMQQLSTYGAPFGAVRHAGIQISAGDDESGMAIVFSGTIQDAFADYSGMPEIVFNVTAYSGLTNALKPVDPSSYKGTADVGDIMGSLAKTMGYTFENNGVSVKLTDPYFSGTAWTQATECAYAADINILLDKGKLSIWPKYGNRSGDAVMVSSDTGMVGYPTFTNQGVVVTMLFDPTLEFGRLIKVQSSLKPASGTWVVTNMVYELASEMVDGPWFMKVEAYAVNLKLDSGYYTRTGVPVS